MYGILNTSLEVTHDKKVRWVKMATMREAQRTGPDLDDDGFLLQPGVWTKDVAQLLAKEDVEGELTAEHWEVIDYLRAYYLHTNSVPPVRMLTRDTGFNLKYITRLFPAGLTMSACRLAGIPREAIRPTFQYP
jgi:tRNA 2-thiouridine synthesizing protein E